MYKCILLIITITLILIVVYNCSTTNILLRESFSSPSISATITLMIDSNWSLYVDDKPIANGGPTGRGIIEHTLTLRPYSKVRMLLDASGRKSKGIRGQIKVGDAIFVTNSSNWKITGQKINPNKTHYQPFSGGKYMGCFIDEGRRALPTYVGTMSGQNIIQKCHQAAIDRKAPYYAMQAGNQCFVGFDYSKYGYLPDKRCTTRCHGSSNQFCGGTWANQVYSTLDAPEIQELNEQALREAGDTTRDDKISAASMWIIPRGQYWPGDWPQGEYEFVWINNPPNRMPFCNYPRFNEFLPSACKDAQDPYSCWSSQKSNYQADSSKCKKIYKPSPNLDSETFFSIMNRAYRKARKDSKDPQLESYLESTRDTYKAACRVISASGEKAPYEGLCKATEHELRDKIDYVCKKVPIDNRHAPEFISQHLLHCTPGSLGCQQLETECKKHNMCFDDTEPKAPRCYKPPKTSEYVGENSARFYSAITKAQKLSSHPKLKNGAEVGNFKKTMKEMIKQGRIAEFNPMDKTQCNCQNNFNDPKSLRCYPC